METIKYLDYEIKMTGDGIVISKNDTNEMPGAMNFGKEWIEEEIDKAKRAATLLFMIERPHIFGASLYYRLTGRGGAYWEHGNIKKACKEAGVPIPEELVDPIDGMNFLIGFKGGPLHKQ